MTRIILVRHGETTWNVEGRYQGQEDTPLSERGLEQGRLLAEGLKNIPLDRAISSPLQRSFKTCQFCADLHDLSVSADERLSEINHGSWEGRLASEIAEAYPEDFARWHSQPHLVVKISTTCAAACAQRLTNTWKNIPTKPSSSLPTMPSTKPSSVT